MNYEESDQRILARFFGEWQDYCTFNAMADAPESVRFHAFRAAWAWHEPSAVDESRHHIVASLSAPPEYQMLKDWLSAKASGYWEPVGVQ